MLKKRQEIKDEEDRQSLKQINVCNAIVDNNINAWISCKRKVQRYFCREEHSSCCSSD